MLASDFLEFSTSFAPTSELGEPSIDRKRDDYNVTLANSNTTAGYELIKFSTGIQILIHFMYILITIISLCGNTLVVVILRRGRRSKTEFSFYLISLACADIIVALFCIPFTVPLLLFNTWPKVYPNVLCPIITFLQVHSVTTSIYTLVAIGIDRYRAILYPLSAAGKLKAQYVVLLTWCAAGLFASVELVFSRVAVDADNVTLQCAENWPVDEARPAYTVLIFVVTYAAPLSVLCFTYTSIWVALKHRQDGITSHSHNADSENRKIWKLTLALIGTFAVCWLPWNTYRLVVEFDDNFVKVKTRAHDIVYVVFTFASHWLAMANCFLNPLVYSFVSSNFRQDLKDLVYSCRCLASATGRNSDVQLRSVATRADCTTLLPSP